MTRRGAWVQAPLLLALLVSAAPARAAEPSETAKAHARALFDRGQRYFDLGQFDKARQLYEEAYKAMPLAGFLFNIAQCHRKLGHHDKALRNYRAYLEKRPDADNRAVVLKLIVHSEDALKRQRAEAAAAAAAAAPARDGAGSAAAGDDSDGSSSAGGGWSKGLVIGGIATSVALLSTALITGLMAKDRSDRFNDLDTPHDDLRGLEDSGRALGATCIVTVAAGSTAAVATLIYYLAKRKSGGERRSKQARRARSLPSALRAGGYALPGGGGLSLSGRF